MKEGLLTVTLITLMFVQSNIYGKCNPVCGYVRLSDSYEGEFSYNHVDTISISQGDTLELKYYLDEPCNSCLNQTLFYKDDALIQQYTLGYHDTLTALVVSNGLYRLDVSCGHICTFRIISSPTDIYEFNALTLPFPLSQLSFNIKNFRYKIVNAIGQQMEEGKFTGEIILRNTIPYQTLKPGIYFVIYYDALDNRQVLTDKVFVGNHP